MWKGHTTCPMIVAQRVQCATSVVEVRVNALLDHGWNSRDLTTIRRLLPFRSWFLVRVHQAQFGYIPGTPFSSDEDVPHLLLQPMHTDRAITKRTPWVGRQLREVGGASAPVGFLYRVIVVGAQFRLQPCNVLLALVQLLHSLVQDIWRDVIQPLLHNVPQTLASRGQRCCGVHILTVLCFKALIAASHVDHYGRTRIAPTAGGTVLESHGQD